MEKVTRRKAVKDMGKVTVKEKEEERRSGTTGTARAAMLMGLLCRSYSTLLLAFSQIGGQILGTVEPITGGLLPLVLTAASAVAKVKVRALASILPLWRSCALVVTLST